ncbi:hypothetical protein TorRG33x02_241050 [Trema orientale]|uniref:Uncharacterized protein n=1 Tax=Trema orientale TaxID=63057 RepID=A0A2P5DV08_TREOI|nr:hypothetical protein TorRG33x02_241050 [Trema orientale]
MNTLHIDGCEDCMQPGYTMPESGDEQYVNLEYNLERRGCRSSSFRWLASVAGKSLIAFFTRDLIQRKTSMTRESL